MKNKIIMACIVIVATLLLSGAVYAAGEIEVTDGEYYFHGSDEPAYDSGYFTSISVDGKVYYFDDETYDKMCEYDSNFAYGFMAQFGEDSNSVDVKNVLGVKVGSISSSVSSEPFYQDALKTFSFDFEKGTVGLNSDANIITEVYDENGNKL